MRHLIIVLAISLVVGCSSIPKPPAGYSNTVPVGSSATHAAQLLESKYPHSLWVTARTPSYRVAEYSVEAREKIEREANAKYPDEIRGNYGAGESVISVAADGRILEINLLKSSGNDALDQALLRMIRNVEGQLPPFHEKLKQQAEVLHIPLPFSFTQGSIRGAQPSRQQ